MKISSCKQVRAFPPLYADAWGQPVLHRLASAVSQDIQGSPVFTQSWTALSISLFYKPKCPSGLLSSKLSNLP